MMRIVIIDDESIIRQWVQKKIEDISTDYKIVGAFSNGRQALDFCKNEIVDVIFTDIRMSTMDGMELLVNLQKLNQHPYKVILSAYDDFEYAREALKLGVHEFLLKPEITQDELKRILHDAQEYLTECRNTTDRKEKWKKENQEILRNIMQNMSTMTDTEVTNLFQANNIELQKSNLVVMDIYSIDWKGLEKLLDIIEIFFEEKHIRWHYFWENSQEIIILYNQTDIWTRQQLAEELYNIAKMNVGVNLYIGVSLKTDGWIKISTIWHQAVIARENRYFYDRQGFILYDEMTVNKADSTGELLFNEEHKEIAKLLDDGQYDTVKEKVNQLLENMKQTDFLPPTYVKAICNEILTSFIQRIHGNDLDAEQKECVRQIQLLLGENVHLFADLKDRMKKSGTYLCDLLEQKSLQGKYSDSIKEVIDYVNVHYKERIVMKDIAEMAHISRTYLSILFKKETGEKFSDYLQKIRLKKACELLKGTNQQITEIAENTGFFDVAHFSRVFKEHYSVSPGEYRKQNNRI